MTHQLQRTVRFRLLLFGLFCALLLLSSLPAGAWQPPIRTVPRTDLTDVAVAGFAGDEPVIFYNPLYLQRMGYAAETFFFAHEYAHHRLGHLKGLAEVMKGDPGEIARKRLEYEREADCYAATLLAEEEPREVEAAISFFETVQAEGRLDRLHPTGYQRAAVIRDCSLRALANKKGEAAPPPDDPEASRTVGLTPVDLGWKAPQRVSVVSFVYRCRNTGSRPVRCSVLIEPADEGTGRRPEGQRFTLELSPGDVRTLKGSFGASDSGSPRLRESLSCVFTGPEVPVPGPFSAPDFLSFAGLQSGDDVSKVLARFGLVMPRPGRVLSYLDYFNGGLSVGCDRATKRVGTVDVMGIEGVEALRGMGINDSKLSLIGKSKEYVLKALGGASADPKAPTHTIEAAGVTVTFSCYGDACNQITVKWK